MSETRYHFQNPRNGWPMVLSIDESDRPYVYADDTYLLPASMADYREAERYAAELTSAILAWWEHDGMLWTAARWLKKHRGCTDID